MAAKIVRLYCIHFFALIAVAISIYYPGLDIALAILYILIIGKEAAEYDSSTGKNIIITALSLHLPGFILVIINLAGVSFMDLSSYALFILQYWYIPLIPLISLTIHATVGGIPLYNYILIFLPILMSLYYYMVWIIKNKLASAA